MRPRSLLYFLLVIVASFGIDFCSKDGSKDRRTDTIKVGALCPFTGPLSQNAEDLKAGIDLACEIINQPFDLNMPLAKENGLPSHGGARIEIIYKDSQGDPKIGAEKVEELFHQDQAAAIMGCYTSSVTVTASERAEVLKIPFINATSTSPMLTRRGFKWFFRTTPDDEMFAQNFFTFLSQLSDTLNIVIPPRLTLVFENRLWGTGVAQAERKQAMNYGYRIIDEIPYDAKESNFDEELKRIESSDSTIIFQTSYDRDAVLFMKEYKARQINPIAILAMDAGFISPFFLESLGPDGEYVMSREVWALDIADKYPLISLVNDLFKSRYGRNMNGNSARAFTGLIVLADAINRASSLDRNEIREALIHTDIRPEQLIMPWDGVKFDPATGQNILGKGIIVQVQDGQYRTIWPWTLSSRRVIWPMPPWSEREAKK